MKDHEKAQLVNDLKKEIMVLCPSAPAQLRAVISRVVNSHTNYFRFEMREDGSCSKCRENFAVCNGLCHDCLEEMNPIRSEPTSENEMTKTKTVFVCCDSCEGSGEGSYGEKCPECGGSGGVPEEIEQGA